MARTIRKSGVKAAKEVALSEIKDDLSRYLREAETQEIVGPVKAPAPDMPG